VTGFITGQQNLKSKNSALLYTEACLLHQLTAEADVSTLATSHGYFEALHDRYPPS